MERGTHLHRITFTAHIFLSIPLPDLFVSLYTTILRSSLVASIMGDFNAVAKQFVDFYYNTFDTNRASLSALYVGANDIQLARDRVDSCCSSARRVC
jgi:hypothetical protein